MALSFLRLVFLFAALSAIVESRQQRETSKLSRRRHGKHYASNYPYRYPGKRYGEEDKYSSYDGYGEGMIEFTPFELEEQVSESPPETPDIVEVEEEKPKMKNDTNEASQSNCPSVSCHMDFEQSKDIRIMQIKDQILKQTGIKTFPNMTGFILPENPYLESIICNVTDQIYSRNANEALSMEPNFRVEYAQNQSSFMRSFKCNLTAQQPSLEDQQIRPVRSDIFSDDPNIKSEKIFLTSTNAKSVLWNTSGDYPDLSPESVKIPMGKLHFFNLSSEHPSSIEQAILHIYLKPISGFVPKDKVAQISFFKVEPPKFQHDYNRLRSVPSVNNVITVPYSSSGSWEKVDIFSLVREWLSNHVMNLGFVINITVDGINLEIDTAEEDPAHAPMLEMDVKEEKNDRQKRYIGNRICSEEKRERECCRYPLIVDFTEYEYDFIVAPKKYVANYCRGECPFLYAHKLPHSTVLQQMFPNTSTYHHGPCCGASDLAPLKMVYYDGSKIKIETIEDMVVIQCSCK